MKNKNKLTGLFVALLLLCATAFSLGIAVPPAAISSHIDKEKEKLDQKISRLRHDLTEAKQAVNRQWNQLHK